MALDPGTRLGPYEIVGALGAGGMGEVYRARDTRLDRSVAVKVLPSELAADRERRARFEREARVVAALDHTHICGIHDVGEAHGTHFLVMPLVEGQTLAARLENSMRTLADQRRVSRLTTGDPRTQPLRERMLARALFLLGDHDGVARAVLENYAQDMRGHFARHAVAVLASPVQPSPDK